MEYFLPIVFIGLMGFALLVYIILDGYDLGIGILLPFMEGDEKDVMIASIGPFWDANETWLVLGIGILLIAFPVAHGMILTALYLPVTIMLIALILRGVAFDFRVKAQAQYKNTWNKVFFIGSLLATMAQGWMLGSYVMGLQNTAIAHLFSFGIALTLPGFYVMLGCGWLFIKTEGELFNKAARIAYIALIPLAISLLLISIATPVASQTIAQKWFTLPEAIGLMPIPIATAIAFFAIYMVLSRKHILEAGYGWIVFLSMIVICLMLAIGLAYSIFPDIVIGRVTIWESAAAADSLLFALIGVCITMPMIMIYTVLIYRIFSGKAQELSYE